MDLSDYDRGFEIVFKIGWAIVFLVVFSVVIGKKAVDTYYENRRTY
jgi:hypothetical protein